MRDLGYRVVDLLVEHTRDLRQKSVTRSMDKATLASVFHEPPPEEGHDLDALLETASEDIFGNVMYVNHPRFFAFAPSPSNFVSVMADALASGFNVFSGISLEGSAAAQVEETVIDWLRQICGFPQSAGGVLVSGGSMANLTALAAARKTVLGDEWHNATIYCSDQTHASIDRAASILGFREGQLRRIPSNDGFQIDMDLLIRTVRRDRRDGLHPFCVVANAGTINTGAVDPLPDIASLCKDEQMWFHIDGAYGAPTMLTDEGRALLWGLEWADSLSLDPHKWLFQPFDIGCVLVRDRPCLKEAFHVLPEYLKVAMSEGDGTNFCDFGPELTRRFRAFKLWMSIKAFGLGSFRRAVEVGLENARFAESQLRASDSWEILTPANLGVVTFRYRPRNLSETELNGLNLSISRRCLSNGFSMVITTELRNKTALRFCTINPRTSREDISETIRRLERDAISVTHTLATC